jgi:hypothetical protein
MSLLGRRISIWAKREDFNESDDIADRDSEFSAFNGNRALIIPVLMTMSLARDATDLRVVRFIRFIRNVRPASKSWTRR